MKTEPYENAIQYLEDELGRYLPLRVARLNSERQVKDLTSDILEGKSEKSRQRANILSAEHRAKQLLELDVYTRSEIDVRLGLTRDTQNESGFSLDRLDADMDADARLILLTLTSTALGMVEYSVGELAMSYYGSVSTSDVMNMLDVKTITHRLQVRRLLLDLADKGFIHMDYPNETTKPEDFSGTQVSLSRRAFSVILDDPELENEGTVLQDGNETH